MAWARLLLRGLSSSGVRRVVISPGSRSTPLVLAAAEEPGITCHTMIDERSAGFFALGQIRATGTPTALLCTSGTAGAHYLPAIIEAHESFLPLIILTADRPWEAYDVASPQTIDQLKLFGGHVRHSFEVGLPDSASSALRGVIRIAAQAVHRSLHPLPGPVHINAHFRKPLEPVDVPGREPWQDEVDRLLSRGAPSFRPALRTIDPAAVESFARACVGSQRGIIACGPSAFPIDDSLRLAVGTLALATGFPVFTEATSQLRFGPWATGPVVVGAFDSLLRATAETPDLIIEIGSTPVSGAYATFVERNSSVPRWVIAQHGWHDPFNSAAVVVEAAPAAFATETASWVTAADDSRSMAWARRWADADAVAWSIVEREWTASHLTEGAVARLAAQALPERSWFMVGNSGPVRDLDTWAAPHSRTLRVVHQRGASGIDGLVSGATGLRSVVDEPVLLYLGDVSLLHDLGGLATARHAKTPLVILAVQNDGGRIFEQLPISRRAELAEPLADHFVTPHGLSFEHAAALFGIAYERPATVVALDAALTRACEHPGCTLIEAVVVPEEGQQQRLRVWRAIGMTLAEKAR
jgi:2-succinyl-5-enolpyruvyl-6-hydroxy-3-cyclohexene-1-carboxylate synthase